VQISALTGEGLAALREQIADRFSDRLRAVRLLIPYGDGRVLTDLYELGAPIEERVDSPEGVLLVAHLPRREVARFAPYLLSEAAITAHGR
jgi:50S ribosomal subunit-associated GTPase HflX